jgi:peptidoglycan glycosyltransferase
MIKMMIEMMNKKICSLLIFSLIFISSGYGKVHSPQAPKINSKILRSILSQEIMAGHDLPNAVEYSGETFSLAYSLNKKLQKFIKKILLKYKSDYTSVVVLDNESGNILGMLDYSKKLNLISRKLTISSSHPSASLFKIVTAAEIIENSGVDANTMFSFNGRSTTLYKNQLKDKFNRWTRFQSFQQAFAKSNNVIFGKAAVYNVSGLGLYKMANRFGFNEFLMDEIRLPSSQVNIAESSYNLAEIASGFNRGTMMSPIHAALLPSVIANNGVLKFPSLLDKVYSKEGYVIWNAKNKSRNVIDADTALSLESMMVDTVTKGTARRSFRRMKKGLREGLKIGGKTGTITGGSPHGKRDWFVSFAVPEKDTEDKGISLCVMNVNVKKWRVKSTQLAKEIIQYYYTQVSPLI